jgi:predicted dehydrogenase
MNKKRKVAIIGAGIGREHLAAFQQLPERFHVKTLCDLDKSRAEEVIGENSDTHYSASFDEVLADADIDLVDVCLPPHLHFEHCERAMLAGKSVICEKPLVSSVKDADRLIDLAKETGQAVYPVFQYRYGLGGLQMRKLIDRGLAGDAFVGTLETHWHRNTAYYEPQWRGTWAGEQGGAVLNHAIHMHDWLSYIFGPVESVYAELATRVNDIEVEDCAAISLRMKSGALVTSSITLGAADDTSRLRFCFNGLTAESGSNPYAPAEGHWTFKAREPYEQQKIDDVLANVSEPPAGYVGLFTALADALDGRTGQEVTLEDGRRSLEFVSAVYASARQSKPIKLPLTAEHSTYTGWGPA